MKMTQEQDKIFRSVAALCLIREKEHRDRNEFWGAVAYANAYDWLCYAVEERMDCLSNFDGMEEAIAFAEAHSDVALWELEEIYKGW